MATISHVILSKMQEEPEPAWVESLRNLTKYSLKIYTYDDWRYVHIISITNDTQTKPRQSDEVTFSPLKIKKHFFVEENSDGETLLKLELLIALLLELVLKPCKYQYEYFLCGEFSVRPFVEKPLTERHRLAITFRCQLLGLFTRWLWKQPLAKLSEMAPPGVVRNHFENFRPVVTITDKVRDSNALDQNDLVALLSKLTIKDHEDDGIIKVKEEPK